MEDEDQVSEELSVPINPLLAGDSDSSDVAMNDAADANPQVDVGARKRRPMFLAAAAAALVVVIALIAIGAGGPGSKDAAAEVMLGARTTLAKNSVDLTLSGSISSDGQTVPVSGSGFADRATGLESITLGFSDENIPVQETVLNIHGDVYMQIVENNQNQITRYLPGKQWLEMPVGANQSAGINATTPNVLSQLQVLTQEGNTVVPLGVSTINGETTKGFQVTITTKAMNAAYKRVEAQGGAEAKSLEQSLKSISLQPPVIKLWLSSDNLLVREEVMLNVSSNGATASGDMFMNFSNYGGVSSISTPAAGTVAPFEAFMAAAQASGLH
jgi:hypothetical protein